MTDEKHDTTATILSELQAAAEQAWGPGRRDALGPLLQRAASALATVMAFDLPPDVEPFPTGPEAPHG